MELLIDIFCNVVADFFQALTAIMWPTRSRATRRLQWLAGGLLLGGALMLGAVCWNPLAFLFWGGLQWTAVGVALLGIAGVVGHSVEMRCRDEARRAGATDPRC